MRAYLYPTLTILAILVLWEVTTILFRIPKYLLPPPSDVVLVTVARWSLLFTHSLITAGETVIGFLISVVIGIPLAVLIVYSKFFEKTIYPLLVASQTIPKIAIAPLFVVWFGFGTTPKMIVAFLIAFFPVVIDTVVGLRSTEPEMLYLVRSMGASNLQAFMAIRLPNALPNIMGGLKIAVTLAVVGAIVGEFIGSDQGLGYLLLVANGNLDTTMLFAAIMVLALIGVILFFVIELLERLLIPWHVSRRLEEASGTM